MDTKIKILIASVLKPVDDVRSSQKIGRSLAQKNKYAVNIIGFKSKKINNAENISVFPVFNFKRGSFSRLIASWKYYKIYLKVKPELIIVSSAELLIVSYIIRILFGTKIIYDVQENYRLNIKFSRVYASALKPLLTTGIRITEWLSRFFVSGYLLAEQVYAEQLDFIHKREYEVILNKSLKIATNEHDRSEPLQIHKPKHFIYSGTIGQEYGTHKAIDFIHFARQTDPSCSLTIVGYSPDNKYLKTIQKAVAPYPYIQLKGGSKPVTHAKIVEETSKADMAIMPYKINENLLKRIPTKFYECIALRKPMIIPPNKYWAEFLAPYPAAVSIDFEQLNGEKVADLLQKISGFSFYQAQPLNNIYWESEEDKLIDFITEILSK